MPYAIRKVRSKSCWRVYNTKTRKVFSKCATKENAEKQVRLLRGLENNPNFRKQIKLGIRQTRRTRRNSPK